MTSGRDDTPWKEEEEGLPKCQSNQAAMVFHLLSNSLNGDLGNGVSQRKAASQDGFRGCFYKRVIMELEDDQ